MLKCIDFYNICKKHDFTFFTGIPDSTFKSWMSFLERSDIDLTNILAVNECEASAICAGYYLSTGKIGVLYTQNDGFGKTVNPLTSLCDPGVYSIPILLMIGWRGEPGKKDAIQHRKMGRIILPLLDLLEIPYEIISADLEEVDETLKRAKEYMQKNSNPFALIVRKGVFEELESDSENGEINKMGREEAVRIIMRWLNRDEIIVSTTGKISRELFEYRVGEKQGCKNDFYNVGAMGCAQSIALGIALQKKDKKVFVFDGDGAILMQMGAIATIGHYAPENFYHIIFDNQVHDSTGGQPTCSDTVKFDKVALACNYIFAQVANEKKSLERAVKNLKEKKGPSMLVVKVKKGARKDLRRPTLTPKELKKSFMNHLKGN